MPRRPGLATCTAVPPPRSTLTHTPAGVESKSQFDRAEPSRSCSRDTAAARKEAVTGFQSVGVIVNVSRSWKPATPSYWYPPAPQTSAVFLGGRDRSPLGCIIAFRLESAKQLLVMQVPGLRAWMPASWAAAYELAAGPPAPRARCSERNLAWQRVGRSRRTIA